MKAISIRQPWIDLILQGRKTIEVRRWPTKHRGRIALHAAYNFDYKGIKHHGIDKAQLRNSAILGTVDIVDMIEFDRISWRKFVDQHLSYIETWDRMTCRYGFVLTNARRLDEPRAMNGASFLFEIGEL